MSYNQGVISHFTLNHKKLKLRKIQTLMEIMEDGDEEAKWREASRQPQQYRWVEKPSSRGVKGACV